MRHLSTIIIFLHTVCVCWSMSMNFVPYNVDDGLSHNNVSCILQDSYGFMWFGTPDGLNRFDGREFRVFQHDPSDPSSIGSNSVLSLYEDESGILWTGTTRGVYLYNPPEGGFSKFTVRTGDNVMISTPVNKLTGRDGYIWIGTEGQGIFIYDTARGILTQNSTLSIVKSVCPDNNGNMWLSGEQGSLAQLDTGGSCLEYFRHTATNIDFVPAIGRVHVSPHSLWYCTGLGGLVRVATDSGGKPEEEHRTIYPTTKFNTIFPFSDTTLMVGGNNVLLVVELESGQAGVVIDKTTGNPYDRTVNDIYRDREGGLWIATRYSGIEYVPRDLKVFESYLNDGKTVNGARMVNAFCYADGVLWVGTEDDGLVYVHPETGLVTRHPAAAGMEGGIKSLMHENGKLWIGTLNHGIYVMDIRSGRTSRFVHSRYDINTLSDNTVNKIYRDSRGTIYAGTPWGLSVYDGASGTFLRDSHFGNQSHITDIMEDRRGNLWFTTYGLGIQRYCASDGSWRHFPQIEGRLPSNYVTCISEDGDGTVWIGTLSGLCRLDYTDDRIEGFDTRDNALSSMTIYSIEHEKPGILWLATNTGLVRLDAGRRRIIHTFTRLDGLQSTQLNARASYRTPDGRLYFGGINGFNSFRPAGFYDNNHIPGIYITSVKIGNEEAASGYSGPAPSGYVSGIAPLKVGRRNNSVTFGFAALSYQLPLKNRYQYFLEGKDTQWTDAGNRNYVTYDNLPPGKYRFLVRGSNNDGIWNSHFASVSFRVMPPFYQSVWAYIIYTLLAIAGGWAILRHLRMRQLRKMKEFKTQQEQLAYRSKIELFTNLAHEIRTPLSLIKLPVENILDSGDGTKQTRDYLNIIDRNTSDLLLLVNEILDFRKSEESGFSLSLSQNDIRQLVLTAAENFEPSMKLRGITLDTVFNGDCWEQVFDLGAVSRILTNLLSNAGKYARTKTRITVEGQPDGFTLTVEDDGPGINEKEASRIFEAFYQAHGSAAGTGIGLSLAKRLTELHGGEIRVLNSGLGGALFRLKISNGKAEPAVGRPEKIDFSPKHKISKSSDRPASIYSGSSTEIPSGKTSVTSPPATILLVEDNDQLKSLTSESLSAKYRVFTASNGLEALSLLESENIDIVVSDLMMPEMDGYELCAKVKSDIRYSHIPVVSLTAKAGIDDRIKGLEYGADAYITKPFSLKHLTTQIENLLDNRRRLHDLYRRSPFPVPEKKLSANGKDSEFIEKLNREISARLQDENFYIDDLATVMYMSRSNFYRKIKALFGVSPNEYLKGCRLRYAAELLARPDIRISQVFVEAGFNSNSYFSKCFKEYYGMTPSQYCEKYSG